MIGSKYCSRCKVTKPLTEEFWGYADKKHTKWQAYCKVCQVEYQKEWRSKTKDKHRDRNNELARMSRARLKEKDPDGYKEKKAKEYQKYKARALEHQKEYAKNNRCKIIQYQHEYREKNRNELNEKAKKYYHDNKSDPMFRLKCQARHVIRDSFSRKNHIKNQRSENITGISIDEFCKHLLETYKKTYGIDWGGSVPVHIDHIIPLATAKTEEDVIRLCHYTNLQLLTAKDNLKKGSAYANC